VTFLAQAAATGAKLDCLQGRDRDEPMKSLGGHFSQSQEAQRYLAAAGKPGGPREPWLLVCLVGVLVFLSLNYLEGEYVTMSHSSPSE